MKEELDKILESDAAVKADFEAKIKTVDFAEDPWANGFLILSPKEGMVWRCTWKALGNRPERLSAAAFQPQQKVWTKLFR